LEWEFLRGRRVGVARLVGPRTLTERQAVSLCVCIRLTAALLSRGLVAEEEATSSCGDGNVETSMWLGEGAGDAGLVGALRSVKRRAAAAIEDYSPESVIGGREDHRITVDINEAFALLARLPI